MPKAKFPAGRELKEICKAFIDEPQIATEDLQDRLAEKREERSTETLQDRLAEKRGRRSIETLNKIRDVVRTVIEITGARQDPAVVQRRKEHWGDLAGLCQRIVSARDYNLNIGRLIRGERSIKRFLESPGEVELTDTNYYLLQRSLLVHLKAEFPELAELKHLNQLKVKYVDELAQLAARRSFKGTCDMCKSWSS